MILFFFFFSLLSSELNLSRDEKSKHFHVKSTNSLAFEEEVGVNENSLNLSSHAVTLWKQEIPTHYESSVDDFNGEDWREGRKKKLLIK